MYNTVVLGYKKKSERPLHAIHLQKQSFIQRMYIYNSNLQHYTKTYPPLDRMLVERTN